MPPRLRKAPLHRRFSHAPRPNLAALVLLTALLFASGMAGAESAGQAPSPFEPTEGVPAEWTVALNDYVSDPVAGGPRLIALTRQSDIELPPMVQVVVADAYLRGGNRRAAERMFQDVLASNPGYPWEDFSNLGMGTARMMSGDSQGAEVYFGRLENGVEASSRVLGHLGKGSALAAEGRYDEARAAFDKASGLATIDEEYRQAGRFGSASARYAAGDYAGAARAFEEIAAIDPDGPMAQDARYAAARARLALGEFDEGTDGLRAIAGRCPEERGARRPSRALRNLDPRAIGRTWVRNYRRTAWVGLFTKNSSMYSIDGCALARATLPAAERGDPRLMGAQRISTAAAAEPAAGRDQRPRQSAERPEPVAAAATPGAGWLPLVGAAIAAGALALLWRRRASAGRV